MLFDLSHRIAAFDSNVIIPPFRGFVNSNFGRIFHRFLLKTDKVFRNVEIVLIFSYKKSNSLSSKTQRR